MSRVSQVFGILIGSWLAIQLAHPLGVPTPQPTRERHDSFHPMEGIQVTPGSHDRGGAKALKKPPVLFVPWKSYTLPPLLATMLKVLNLYKMVTLDFRNEQRLGNILGPKNPEKRLVIFVDYVHPLLANPKKTRAPGKFRGDPCKQSDPSRGPQKEAGS